MGRLIYSANTSLDGYIADTGGGLDWAIPDAEVHQTINDLVRPASTHLYGRRMYDVMSVWETMDDEEPVMRDFAQLWTSVDKIVYSRTLTESRTARTRIEPEFDPDAVRALLAEGDALIGGAELAGQALAAGLIDDLHCFVWPVVIGGGKSWLPDDVRCDLQLVDTRRFASGVVHLHYRTDG